MTKRGIDALGARLAKPGASDTGRRQKAAPASSSSKTLLLEVSREQWLGLKSAAMHEDKTLKAVCLEAFDAYLAKRPKGA